MKEVIAISYRTCSIDGCTNHVDSRGWCSKHYRSWLRKRPKTCTVQGCDGKFYGRGMCSKHYQKWRKHGDPLHIASLVSDFPCNVEECGDPAEKHGWCMAHYTRWYRHGNPLGGAGGRFESYEDAFLASAEWRGGCLIWNRSVNSKGYAVMGSHGDDPKKLAHRYAWERVNGSIPEGMQVDHKDCYTPSCVNVEHLRLATHSENLSNRSGPQKGSASGVRNVYPYRGRWKVEMTKNHMVNRFGVFDTIEEAAVVAEQAREELFGEYAGRG